MTGPEFPSPFGTVDGELASTRILKPESTDNRLPMLVANEHFSMSLAARLNLPAAPVSIIRVPDPVLVVERFDRARVPGGVRRLHIIDACQALNFPVSYKYCSKPPRAWHYRRTAIPRPLLAREMRRMGTTVIAAAKLQATAAAYTAEERDFVTRIAGFVQSQAQVTMACTVRLSTGFENRTLTA